MRLAIGVDIGGTTAAAGIVDPRGGIREPVACPPPAEGGAALAGGRIAESGPRAGIVGAADRALR
ncbi:MAG: hypothetical protein M0026_01285 [Nocardiopsaceae bacterium]|nr:hypothetical protein [Nocardiopsaceae bacterium]